MLNRMYSGIDIETQSFKGDFKSLYIAGYRMFEHTFQRLSWVLGLIYAPTSSILFIDSR